MKKSLKYLLVFIAIPALALVSCVKENDTLSDEDAARFIVNFVAQTPETKTVFGMAEGNNVPTLWEKGDEMAVICNMADGVAATVVDGGKSAEFTAEFAKIDAAESYTFYAVYPYVQEACEGGKAKLVIPSEQTPLENNVAKGAMGLVARSEPLSDKPTEAVSLAFKHATAYGCITRLGAVPETANIQSITITSDHDIAGTFLTDCSGSALEAADAGKSLTLKTSAHENIWFSCAPFEGGKLSFEILTDAGTWSVEKDLTGKKFEAGKIARFSIAGFEKPEPLSFTIEKMEFYKNYTATLAEDAKFLSGNTYSYYISASEGGAAISGLAPKVFDSVVEPFILNDYLTDDIAKNAKIVKGQKLWFVSKLVNEEGTELTKSYEFTYALDHQIDLTADMISNPLEFNSGKDGISDMGSVAYLIDGNKMTKWQPANTYKDMSADERKSKYGWDGTSPVCYPYYTKLSSEWFSKYPGAEDYDFTAGPNAGVWIDFVLPEGITSFSLGYQTNPNWWNGFPCGIRIYAKAAENDEWKQYGPAYAVPSQADGGRITSARNSDYTNAVKTLPASVMNNGSTYAKTWTSDTITIEGNSVRYIRMLITETIDGGNQAKAEQPGWYNLKEQKPDGIWRTSVYNTCLSEVWLCGK